MMAVLRMLNRIAAAVLASAVFAGGAPAQNIPLDRVVAVVNNDAITLSELDARVAIIERRLARQRVARPEPQVLKRQVLERMIMDRAQLQLGEQLGVRVDEAFVDRAVARIAADNGLTLAQFRDRIEREGLRYEQAREDVRTEIILTRLREREIDARIQITEAEVDALLSGQAAQGDVEYLVSQILLRVPESATPSEVERQRYRADEIVRQLEGGAAFNRLSAAFSDAQDALAGGSLGWRSAQRLPQLFFEAVRDLRPGQLAPVVRSPNGFHILQLVDRRSSGAPALSEVPVTQTRARHILIRVSDTVSEQEALRRLRDIVERVRNGSADFAEMARQYSVDGSAPQGGDLGWIYPGDTVPEFERAMAALAPGQISDPVRTPFGLHLIQVLERREQAATEDRRRALARQALRERKIDERYQEWLRELRDRTYVEYRLDDA
ncbi:MAG: peptidylprolyl isomerase [Burkholderiales bacterium]|nr:MAG: peptidylprolyl isomerase [Burkholderiales bacterium]